MRFLQSEARGVVYTCLTGNYDTLREHKYLNKNGITFVLPMTKSFLPRSDRAFGR